MTMSTGTGAATTGSSRYDSSPVGGQGPQPGSAPPPAGTPGRPSAPPAGGYPTTGAPPEGGADPVPTYGKAPRPKKPEYGTGTPPDTGSTTYAEPETPGEPLPGDDPDTPGHGYGPPDEGYEPSDPGYGPPDPGNGEETPDQRGYPPPSSHPCPPSMTCDTRGMDDLQCEAAGVKAESDELAAVATALAKRRTAFETARSAYTRARDLANVSVDKLADDVESLLRDTRCLLNRDVQACIDQAFSQVLECLDDCATTGGCCVDEGCGFGDQSWTVGQMDDLRVQVEKVEKCFDEVLVAEPAGMTARVAAVQALVDQLNVALAAKPREDPSRLYARAKHVEWKLASVWESFADANEFQNCLCRGLTCSLRGRQWLAQLAGKKAYQECQEASRLRRCTWLRDNIVDETLATRLILCPPGSPSAGAADPGAATPDPPTAVS